MKHTKGEWSTNMSIGLGIKARIKSGEIIIADCYSFSEGLSDEEAEANAKLIAAAPELLEALIECSAFLNTVQSPATSARNLKTEIDNAINKATL